MNTDGAKLTEQASVGVLAADHEPIQWRAQWRLEKREGDWKGEDIDEGRAPEPYEVIEGEGNLLLIGGASALFQRLIGTALTAFDAANAHLAVGNSATAAADTQTDLVGASKTRKAMDATYPLHTDSVSAAGAKSIQFRSTFGTAEGNHAWDEWGLANASAAGRMLNRKVQAFGSKTSATSWTLLITLSLA
jgi:hypothetical protein